MPFLRELFAMITYGTVRCREPAAGGVLCELFAMIRGGAALSHPWSFFACGMEVHSVYCVSVCRGS